jgi:hypothetical protein
MMTRTRVLSAAAVAALTLAACGGGSDKTTTTPATTSQIAATTVAPNNSQATTTANTNQATTTTAKANTSGKVNANTASVPELQKAFETAGIPSAQRWAQEVDEYRPYPVDPKWGKLRQELGKYNIAPDVLDKIIATLEL